MIVISDTTPLITLMKANELHVLEGLFGEVFIPEAVYYELTSNISFKEEAELIKNSNYIKMVTVKDLDRVAFLQRATGLDRGESEAIIYADEVKADILLMDEAVGRRVAKNMSLKMTGSVGILIRAFELGIITKAEAEDAFGKIRGANRHISEKLLNSALEIIRGKY